MLEASKPNNASKTYLEQRARERASAKSATAQTAFQFRVLDAGFDFQILSLPEDPMSFIAYETTIL